MTTESDETKGHCYGRNGGPCASGCFGMNCSCPCDGCMEEWKGFGQPSALENLQKECSHDKVSRHEIKDKAINAVLGVDLVAWFWCDNCGQRFAPIQRDERIVKADSKVPRKGEETP